VMRMLVRAVGLVVVLVAAAVATTGWWYWERLHQPYQGYSAVEQFVQVPAGASTASIGRRLADAGVVADPWTFRLAVWWSGRARTLQAGEYRFAVPATPLEVVDTLAEGRVFAQPITFPEGLTLADMARLFESKGLGTARAFLTAAGDETAIADLDPAARDLEGYLFPDTYALPHDATAADVVAQMVERFRTVWADVGAGREAGGLNIRQVMALASLVEKETAAPDERPLVAAVDRNRLGRRMALQADPTVVYALQKAGRYNGNIRKVDLQINSPYNTYRYPCLPPGPIAAPGRAAIEAAMSPADVPYLFFVSRNDGTHAFAESLREHNANVQTFKVEYFRRQRAERRAQARDEKPARRPARQR
jgi:UPF0755 protein